MPGPDLSVVIVSWNVKELLARCLHALSDPSVVGRLRLEIIVVDNASGDGSDQEAARFANVRMVRNQLNLGYGRANNQGLRLAAAANLLVLNPDAIPLPGSLEALVRFATRHPRAGIIAPRLLNPNGTVQRSAFRFPTLMMAALDLFPLPSYVPGKVRRWLYESHLNGRYPNEPQRTQPFQIDHPLGACMLLNRKAFETVGGFDEAIFMYSEEIDLAIRYRKARWECWQFPDARVVHIGGQSTSQARDDMFIELWRSRLYFYRKHRSRAALVLLSCLLILRQVWDIIVTFGAATVGRLPAPEARMRIRRASRTARLVLDS